MLPPDQMQAVKGVIKIIGTLCAAFAGYHVAPDTMPGQVDAVRTVNGLSVARRFSAVTGSSRRQKFASNVRRCLIRYLSPKNDESAFHDITHIAFIPVAGNKFVNQKRRCQNDDV